MLAERMCENEAAAAMRHTMARRQKQAWAWALVMAAGVAGVQFYAWRWRKKSGKAFAKAS